MKVEHDSGKIISFPFGRHSVDAFYQRPPSPREEIGQRPAILRLHGILGNLLDESEYFLPQVLASAGYSSITMNTVLANLGLFFGFGVFDDTIAQIDAACDFLRQAGFKKIIVAGHGLGGCMAIRFGAMANESKERDDIVGIIAVATPYSMPDTVRRRWNRFGSEPSYEEFHQRAGPLFKGNDKGNDRDASSEDEIVIVKRAHGTTSASHHADIYTLKTWWALAGPEADGPRTHKHISQIRVPMLLIHGSQDSIVQASEFEDLARIARESGNSDVTAIELDANHTFDRKHEELGRTMTRWLAERHEHWIDNG